MMVKTKHLELIYHATIMMAATVIRLLMMAVMTVVAYVMD